MNLAQESMQPDESSDRESEYVPTSLKTPINPEFENVLRERFLGKNVRLSLGRSYCLGTLQDIISHNGQLILDLGNELVAWTRCESIEIRENS